ncbi:MAG: response regulator transcription factor [Burkholderiaceae bacterium]|jgi:DNA-binding response OmpR family regulator
MDTPLEIVLVEDHDQLRRVTMAVLRARGHRVVALTSAEEVDDSITLSKPDIFILDLNLPGEDGVSLARRIRAAHPRVGIIMTTVRREVEQRLAGYESGADAYLPKPTDVEELSAAVESLGRRVRDPLGVRLLANEPQAETPVEPLGQTELFERPAGLARLPESAGAATELAMVTLDLPGLQVVGSRRTEAVSESEARLLCALARAHDRQLERWQVASMLGQGEDFSVASLEVRVGRLRKKLVSVSGEARPLRALRGLGYRLCLRAVVID